VLVLFLVLFVSEKYYQVFLPAQGRTAENCGSFSVLCRLSGDKAAAVHEGKCRLAKDLGTPTKAKINLPAG
jgi:hypothetical protein